MTRTVRRLNALPDASHDAAPLPFSNFAEVVDIVLLGDPGAGKTHLFKQTAALESARFIKARDFLNMPADRLQGPALFIDGLDEKRAGRGDRDTLDALVTKLFVVNPSKLRISCRAADWLGESDIAGLRPFFEQRGEICVLQIESLSESEQIAVLVTEGTDQAAAKGFIAGATERGLGDFLENPQNLIMLWRAVRAGAWPKTRKELFKLSTRLMLQEFNAEHARFGSGKYSADELRLTSGAICATRLISDVEAINLTDKEGTAECPGYRSLAVFDPEKVQAALGRRVFDSGPQSETVDYAHRTTAEFLAAEFLAIKVRSGLPLGRVAALIGVEGHPATELRGLHAWLAVHLPEHAERLIKADPYGVLSYGDAASLSPTSCAFLVHALDKLSDSNPWFRTGSGKSRSIGALARPDMVDEFRRILNHRHAGSGVRTLVLEALTIGPPQPNLLGELSAVLADRSRTYMERALSIDALRRLGNSGKAAIENAFRTQFGDTADDLRLRIEILEDLYGDPYGATDVVQVVNATAAGGEGVGTGALWRLPDLIPAADLPVILDGIQLDADQSDFDKNRWEVSRFYGSVLMRAWRAPNEVDPSRLLAWLQKRATSSGSRVEGDRLREVMLATPERVAALAKHFFSTVPVNESRWLAYHRFREAILFTLPFDKEIDVLINQIQNADTNRRSFLYQIALSLALQADPKVSGPVFEQLYERGENDTAFKAVRDLAVVSSLPAGYFSGRSLVHRDDAKKNQTRQQQEFDQQVQQIRTAAHLGWITHIARIYCGLYRDVDRSLSGRDRLAAWLGQTRVDRAIEGLLAALSRNDLPSLADVIGLAGNHQHYDWWYALIAGLDERWAVGQGLGSLSDDFLQAMLAFDITNSTFVLEENNERVFIHPWRKALEETRPSLVRDAYLAVVELRLSKNEQIVEGLTELLTGLHFEAYRGDIALHFLRRFPNANAFKVAQLLDEITKNPTTHPEFLRIAEPIVSRTVSVGEAQYDLWLATAYLVAPTSFEGHVQQRVTSQNAFVFALRDRSGFGDRGHPQETTWPLPMLEFMARLTGTIFHDAPYPSNGWSGDNNPWDASDFFRALVSLISASPSETATQTLVRLADNTQLSSYRPFMLHILANQKQRRRDAEYDRPQWSNTIAALTNGPPATVADLHALVIAQLGELANRVRHENTDIYKQFWNLDRYSRPVDPRPEEACRDDLITLLRPSVAPLGIALEPEGHMISDKRADVSVSMPGRKILCELKRDYHAEVWRAPIEQLERFYAHDPESKGFGVYCVLWFGEKRPQRIPAPPKGQDPKSAAEMQLMLQRMLPENMQGRIGVIIIDVSGQG